MFSRTSMRLTFQNPKMVGLVLQMPTAHTLENRLILACLRIDLDVQSIGDLVEHDPDWQVFLRKIESLGIAPLIYTSLKQCARTVEIPKPGKERLRHIYHREAIASLTLREVLRPVLNRFREAGLPVVVLKGVAMGALIYPSAALRPMKDIDLLIRRDDLGKADVLLRDLGFERKSPEVSDSRLWSDPPFGVLYARPQGFPPIELQQHITSDAAMFVRIPIEDFWKRSRHAQIESAEALVFSTEDLLLHLALHLAKRNQFFGQLRTLRDIGEVCKRYRGEIDWGRLVFEARGYGVSKYLYYSFRLARDLVNADVPTNTLKELRIGFDQLPLEDAFVVKVARQAVLSEDRARDSSLIIYRIAAGLQESHRATDKIALVGRVIGGAYRMRMSRLVGSLRRSHEGSAPSSEPIQVSDESLACGCGSTSIQVEQTSNSRPQNSGSARKAELAVTYDQGPTDGVGAQLQRIYGIYALSRSLHVKYVHTPLDRVGYQGLLPLLEGRTEANFADRYNAFFALPSDDFDLERCQRVRLENLTERTIEEYRELTARTGCSVLLQSPSAYGYTDRHPRSYLALRAISPYRTYRATGPVRICIHLRRGDNVFARQDQRYRLLPNSYYLRTCGTIVNALSTQNIHFVVRLHTELPRRPYTLHPGIQGLYFDLVQPSTIDPNEFGLEDFESLPNLEIVLNAEPQAVLDDFATADVLILSLSSFGYLGGLLNTHGLIVYAPWWHAPLPDWLVASEQGDLDAAQVATRIAEHLDRRERAQISC
jgi:hypothetical protein